MRRARTAGHGVLLVLFAASIACTDGGSTVMETPEASPPVPSPVAPVGTRVGVVLPPTSQVAASVSDSIEAQLAQLSASTDETVRDLRGFAAADPRFVEDVAGWLAEQGTEIVCVLGDRAEAVAVTLAELYRGVRFCALPAGPPSPDQAGDTPDLDGVARVDLRVEELGNLIGVAARTQAGNGAVGLVLGGDALPEQRFRTGLLAGLAGVDVVEAEVPGGRELTLAERAEAVLAAGAEVVVIDGGHGGPEAVEVVGDRAEVLAPGAVFGEVVPASVAVRWTVRWDRALAGPLDSLTDGPGEGRHTSLGLRDGVFEIVLDEGASTAVGRALEVTMERLTDGSPSPRSSPEPAEPYPVEVDP